MKTIVEDAEAPMASDFFRSKGLFTAWQPMQQVAKAAAAKFAWLALQCSPDPGHVQLVEEEIAKVRAAGLKAAVWGVPPYAFPADADAYIVQIETPDQHAEALQMLSTLPDGKPRASVTTFGGSDSPTLVAQLLAHVDLALVECYQPDSPIHADLKRMLWQAGEYGWPHALPVIGLYHGATVDSYTGFEPDKGFAVWVAEELDDQAWLRLAEL